MESKKNTFSKLRKKAEEKLKPLGLLSKKEPVSELVHELDVHKIELQMQNEELLSTQAKLILSIGEYTELFNLAPVGYFIMDKNGTVTNVNHTGLSLLGLTKKQVLGKNLSVFLNSKSSQDDFYVQRNLIIDKGIKQQFECSIKKENGPVFFALIESISVKNEQDKFKYLLSTVIDISKQKEEERLLELALRKEKELNEMKSHFIAMASHEFRTPLSTILTSAELIENYNKPEDADKKVRHFNKIKTSVNRIKEILIDFLSSSEIEKGTIKNSPKEFNLVKFMESMLEEVKAFDGTHVVKYTHIGENQKVILDKNLLKTCLANLLINAYKYTKDGGLIEVVTEQKTPDAIYISIRDNGIGISEKDKKQIFTKFFRAKNVENIPGTGLGLSITKELIGLMNGNISFISKLNEGTTFFIEFLQKK